MLGGELLKGRAVPGPPEDSRAKSSAWATAEVHKCLLKGTEGGRRASPTIALHCTSQGPGFGA